MIDISAIRYKMIGICCVDPKQNAQEHAYIHDAWDKRFLPNTAFLLDAFAPDGSVRGEEQLIETLLEEIRVRGAAFKDSTTCVLAVFYDLRQEIPEELLDIGNLFTQSLQDVLRSYVSVTLNFVQTGIRGLEKKILQTKRENAARLYDRLVGTNISGKMILVAQDPLAERGTTWMPVMVALDTLRREGSYDHLFPSVGKVGYFSYMVYEERERKQISAEIDHISKVLSDKNDSQLEGTLTKRVEQLEQSIVKNFVFEGGLQPQHPGMIVEPGVFNLKRREARQGKGPYADASNATRDAANRTAVRLGEMIRGSFALTPDQADELFETMVNENFISLKWLKNEADVKKALTVPFGQKASTGILELSYNEEGSQNDIGEFIQKHFDAAIYDGKVAYCKALQQAYERHRDSHDYDSEIRRIDQKKLDLQDRLSQLPTVENFCEDNVLTDSQMLCQFNPLYNCSSNSTRFVVFENDDQQIEDILRDIERNPINSAKIYSNNFTNNLAKNDGSPIKVIKVSMYDCQVDDLATLIT